MITRSHTDGGCTSVACYSECEDYRYSLTRTWDDAAPKVAFVMLNPSTADERRNDPTVERCERRARALGYGAFAVVNIFAFRATDPANLKRAKRPIGPGNTQAITDALHWADDVIAAWGAHGAHLGQGDKIRAMLAQSGVPVLHLGLTKAGHPRHPLYVAYAAPLQPWEFAKG